jgi:hypothetical protein
MNEMWSGVVTIASAIVGVAILAVLVSRNSNTSGVISSAASGFAQDLSAAVSPVTGGGNMFGVPSFSGGASPVFIQ